LAPIKALTVGKGQLVGALPAHRRSEQIGGTRQAFADSRKIAGSAQWNAYHSAQSESLVGGPLIARQRIRP
jgi:hypothetical protein